MQATRYNMSNLKSLDDLLPSKSMLAKELVMRNEQVLSSFLRTMDDQEYEKLGRESTKIRRALKAGSNKADVAKTTAATAAVVGLNGTTFGVIGGLIGLCIGNVPGAIFGAAIGGGASAAVGGGIVSLGLAVVFKSRWEEEAANRYTEKRLIRLNDKITRLETEINRVESEDERLQLTRVRNAFSTVYQVWSNKVTIKVKID